MTAFKNILVATDFGESAAQALDCAIALAEKFASTVTLLHSAASPSAALSTYADAEGLHWPTEEMLIAAKRELHTTLSRARERLPKVDGVLVDQEPSQAILEVAKQRGADLIVMGTHGRRGLSRVLLGSVAEKVVRLSPIPVMTVGGKAEREAKGQAITPVASAKKN